MANLHKYLLDEHGWIMHSTCNGDFLSSNLRSSFTTFIIPCIGVQGMTQEIENFIEEHELELEIYAESGYEKSDLVATLLRCYRSN